MNEAQGNHVLPQYWRWANLSDIITFIGSGITPKGGKAVYQSSGIPFIRSQNVYPDGLRLGDVAHINANLHESMSRTQIQPNDVLLNITGASIGRSAVVPQFLKEGNVNQHVCILRLFHQINSRYISWFLNSPFGQKQIMNSQFGVTRQGLNYSQARVLQIPLAPKVEQHRIVARIEELFSRLEAGVEELKKAKAQLQRYRQSVLKAAVEGRLTEVWRKTHKANWYARIFTTDANEISGHPSLPEGWTWARYDQIGKWSGGGTPSKRIASYWTNGSIPWISPKDMKSQKIYDSQDKITSEAVQNSPAKLIPPGSLLFVVRSGIIQRMLPVASLKVEATVNQDLKALTPNEYVNDEYLLYSAIALSENIRNHCSKDGTTVQSIEFILLRNFTIPLPPLDEQQEIVNKVEHNESSLAEVEEFIDEDLNHAIRLRQSILKHAFEGKLVPQDPNDEPASILLERIRAERAKVSAPRSRRPGINQVSLIQ